MKDSAGGKGDSAMEPMQILVDEHNLIRQALDNFSIALDKLEKGERPPSECFEK